MPDNDNAQKPSVQSWIQGGARFKVTHYSYAVEDDPFYANHGLTDTVKVPELGNREFSRGFLGINKDGSVLPSSQNVGVTMQGTGQTLQGDHIKYAGKSGGKATFAPGVGGAHATITRPFEQIAVDPSVIPYGTKVYVEEYGKVMSADDTGGAIKGNHIDIFAGPQTYGNICRLLGKIQSSRLGIVDKNTPTGGGADVTTATTQGGQTANQGNSSGEAPQAQQAQNNAAGTVYTVVSGDTLSAIATRFNVSGGYQALANYNGIANPNLIYVGQKITIPGAGASTDANATKPEVTPDTQAVQVQSNGGQDEYYTVVSGDTLSGIAARFNVPGGYMTIANANNIRNPNVINVGQRLLIPGKANANQGNQQTQAPAQTDQGNQGGNNAGSGNGQAAVAYAERYLYSTTNMFTKDFIYNEPILPNLIDVSWGGSDYNYGYDCNCANFVTAVLQNVGMFGPHYVGVSKIRDYCAAGNEGYHSVSRSSAKPGDIWLNSHHTEIVASNTNGSITLIGSNNANTNKQRVTYDSYSGNNSGEFFSKQ